MQFHNDFCQEAPSNVVDYFNENWYEIREEWVQCYLCDGNFKNFTNNRIESFNQKIKSFVEKSSYLTDFLIQFFQFLFIHKNERDDKAKNVFLKHPLFLTSSDEKKYHEYLTTFAFQYVYEQMKKIEVVRYVCKISDDNYAVKSASSERIKYNVTSNSCPCIDAKSMATLDKKIF